MVVEEAVIWRTAIVANEEVPLDWTLRAPVHRTFTFVTDAIGIAAGRVYYRRRNENTFFLQGRNRKELERMIHLLTCGATKFVKVDDTEGTACESMVLGSGC